MSDVWSAVVIVLSDKPVRSWLLAALMLVLVAVGVVSALRDRAAERVPVRSSVMRTITPVGGVAVAGLFVGSLFWDWLGQAGTWDSALVFVVGLRIAVIVTTVLTLMLAVAAVFRPLKVVALVMAAAYLGWLMIALTSRSSIAEAAYQFQTMRPPSFPTYVWGASSRDGSGIGSRSAEDIFPVHFLVSAAVLGVIWAVWIVLTSRQSPNPADDGRMKQLASGELV